MDRKIDQEGRRAGQIRKEGGRDRQIRRGEAMDRSGGIESIDQDWRREG